MSMISDRFSSLFDICYGIFSFLDVFLFLLVVCLFICLFYILLVFTTPGLIFLILLHMLVFSVYVGRFPMIYKYIYYKYNIL